MVNQRLEVRGKLSQYCLLVAVISSLASLISCHQLVDFEQRQKNQLEQRVAILEQKMSMVLEMMNKNNWSFNEELLWINKKGDVDDVQKEPNRYSDGNEDQISEATESDFSPRKITDNFIQAEARNRFQRSPDSQSTHIPSRDLQTTISSWVTILGLQRTNGRLDQVEKDMKNIKKDLDKTNQIVQNNLRGIDIIKGLQSSSFDISGCNQRKQQVETNITGVDLFAEKYRDIIVQQLGSLRQALLVCRFSVNGKYGDNNYTLLHYAAAVNDFSTANLLILNGANVNVKSKSNWSPLHIASSSNSVQVLDLILDNDGIINDPGHKRLTPLHSAAQNGATRAVGILINRGADIHARTDEQQSALHLAAKRVSMPILKLLVNRSALVDASDKRGNTALHLLALLRRDDSDVREALAFLIDRGANLTARNQAGQTVLHIAAKSGSLNLVKLLVERGMDVNVVDNDGNTLLHTSHLNPKIARVENQRKANVNAGDQWGNTPLHFAVDNYTKSKYLVDNGAKVDIKNVDGNTALHKAIGFEFVDVIRLLLEYSSPINEQNKNGDTPLHLAVGADCLLCVHLLVNRNPKPNMNLVNTKGSTPLQLVKSPAIIELLKSQ